MCVYLLNAISIEIIVRLKIALAMFSPFFLRFIFDQEYNYEFLKINRIDDIM